MAELNQDADMILDLKSAILNIDWEISDDTLQELTQEIGKLQGLWAGEKALLVYLQILTALCQYIGMSRENSHPGTFLLLKESFDSLEAVILDPDLSAAEKNSQVMVYADRYNQLKKEIAAGDFVPGPAAESLSSDEEEEKSTMDELLDDEGDHSTDTVFDSMLNAMVKTPAESEVETVEEDDDEPEPVATTPPPRPAVQASFNKADGTEVEPDRNDDDEFEEADHLLDEFFDDDDIPAPGTAITSAETVFDLNDLPDEDGDDSPDADDDLVIEIDDESEPAPDEDDSFQEMEEALDSFFGEEEDDDLLDPVDDKTEDDSLIDEALDDFFDDEPDPEDDESVSAEDDLLVVEAGEDSDNATAEDETVQENTDEPEPESIADDDAESVEPVLAGGPEETDDKLENEDVRDIEESSLEESLQETECVDDSVSTLPDDVIPSGDSPLDDSEEEPGEAALIELDGEEDDEVASDEGRPPLLITPEDTATEFVVDDDSLAEVEGDASCVENLQMLLLSVEWEVDDKLLLRLQEEVDSLVLLLKENSTACLHLNFLNTVIRYISREQAEVISDSMICLKLIADSLEESLKDQTEDGTGYGENAGRSFIDWHELVVLDFEKRLGQGGDVTESTVDSDQGPAESPDPVLSPEMVEMKKNIMVEVRELIAQELMGKQD